MIRTITLLLLFSFSFVAAEAQYGKKKPRPRSEKEKVEKKAKEKEEKVQERDEKAYEPSDGIDTENSAFKGKFLNNIWYGAGAQLNFGSSGNERYFTLGLSPMAAYKFSQSFSIGPRFDLQYRSVRFDTGFNGIEKESALDKGLGVFSRLKIADIAFLHAEYQHLFGKDFFITQGNDIFTEPFNQNLVLLGAGLYQGDGEWSYNFYITVDVLQERENVNFPVFFRAEIARFF